MKLPRTPMRDHTPCLHICEPLTLIYSVTLIPDSVYFEMFFNFLTHVIIIIIELTYLPNWALAIDFNVDKFHHKISPTLKSKPTTQSPVSSPPLHRVPQWGESITK